MNRSLPLVIIFILLWFAAGCRVFSPPQSLDRKSINNLAYIYNPGSTTIHPMVTVFHQTDSISEFYFGLPVSELQFSQANATGDFLTQLRIYWELHENGISGEKNPADTGTLVYTLRKDQLKSSFITSVPFRAAIGKQYTLRVFATDMVRRKSTEVFVSVNKSSAYTAQNYMVTNGSRSQPYLVRHFDSLQKFRIIYRNPGYNTLYVSYYENRQPLPRPLFSPEAEQNMLTVPDSVWSLPLNDTMLYNLHNPGLYMFRVDTSKAEGLALFNYGDYFPQVKTIDEMIAPLAYLATTREYQQLLSAPTRKLAVDDFWLKCAGNIEQAKELIRIYYNRVFFANYYFSADREGWKTDRGMIFMVFGPPNTLYKSEDEERWIYYKKPGESVTFDFKKAPSPWSENLYYVTRTQAPDTRWRMAVDSWRSGKVFLLQ